MKYIISFLILFIYFYSPTFAQNLYSRDIVVKTDTTLEFNNTRKNPFEIVDPYIDNGIAIRVYESPFQVGHIESHKKGILNGFYIEFYSSGMPKRKGNYLNNDKNGEWFYWNEKGNLMYKELWKKGKMLKNIKFKQG